MADRLLVTKLLLYEPGNARFEPTFRYAVIGGWMISDKHTTGRRVKGIEIPRNMLRRLVTPLPAAAPPRQRIATNARVRVPKVPKVGKGGYQLSYRCFGGIRETKLYDLDSPEKVTALVRAIKRHWSNATGRR